MTAWNIVTGPKQECREAFISGIRDHIARPTDFFVLPSEDAHDAHLIKEEWPRSRIRGVEKEKAIWSVIDADHLHVDTWHMDIAEYVRRETVDKPTRVFDASFLDYTGWMSEGNLRDVASFAARLSKPKFILAVTFQKSVRRERDRVRDSVLNHSCLEDYDLRAVEDGDTGEWNNSLYIADAVCGAIEKRMPQQLSRLEILHHRQYRAKASTAEMFFATILIERFDPI